MRVDASDTAITFQEITATGTVVDTYTIATPQFSDRDIGATGTAGAGKSQLVGVALRVSSSANDIGGTADAFHFASQSLTGDGQVIARVDSLVNTDSLAKAGLMIRSSNKPNSIAASILLQAGGQAVFLSRTSTGHAATVKTKSKIKAPYYLRLTRSGQKITGAISPNGQSWTNVGSATVSLPQTTSIGLAVSSHNPRKLNTASFSQIQILPATRHRTRITTPFSLAPVIPQALAVLPDSLGPNRGRRETFLWGSPESWECF